MTEETRPASGTRRSDPASAAEAAAHAVSRLTDLAKVSVHTQANLAKQSVDLIWATLAGSMDRASANRAYVESMAREGARYWREVGKLSIDCAADLVALGKCLSTSVLREVAVSGRKPGSAPTAASTARPAKPAPRQVKPQRRGSQTPRSGSNGRRAPGSPEHDESEPRAKVSV